MLRPIPPLLAALALVAGCSPRVANRCDPRAAGAPAQEEFAVGSARFRIVYPPEEERAARRVRRAVEAAVPRVARWGGLAHPVTITLHPTRAALEDAVGRPGHGVRAWARRDSVDLQSPRTWGLFGAGDRELEELVAHELAHCATYQRAGDAASWMYRGIPRWFAEGIASVTARQGHRHGRVEDLPWEADDLVAEPDPADPSPDSLYAAAHHAVALLLARYGEARVVEVLALMGGGLRFPAAFRRAIGVAEEEFIAELRREAQARRRRAAERRRAGARPTRRAARRQSPPQPRRTTVAMAQSRSP